MTRKVVKDVTQGSLRCELIEVRPANSDDVCPVDRFRVSVFRREDDSSPEQAVFTELGLVEARMLSHFVRLAVIEGYSQAGETFVSDSF